MKGLVNSRQPCRLLIFSGFMGIMDVKPKPVKLNKPLERDELA
jgi:hypothetical protein